MCDIAQIKMLILEKCIYLLLRLYVKRMKHKLWYLWTVPGGNDSCDNTVQVTRSTK